MTISPQTDKPIYRCNEPITLTTQLTQVNLGGSTTVVSGKSGTTVAERVTSLINPGGTPSAMTLSLSDILNNGGPSATVKAPCQSSTYGILITAVAAGDQRIAVAGFTVDGSIVYLPVGQNKSPAEH